MNSRHLERFTIPGPAGRLEIAVNVPLTAPRGIALVAHPNPTQGGSLDNKVAQTLAKTFVALGYAAVRPNFRGVGESEGVYDAGPGEALDALAALAYARTRFDDGPRLPLVLAGFSFGTYVQTLVAKSVQAERMVLVGPAIVDRFKLDPVPADTIVIQGEEDDVVLLADVLAWARPQQLPVIVFPGCGHYFHGRLAQLQRVITGMWHGGLPAPLPGA